MNFRFILCQMADTNDFEITKTAGLPVGGSAVFLLFSTLSGPPAGGR
jgi:hypothetical protein